MKNDLQSISFLMVKSISFYLDSVRNGSRQKLNSDSQKQRRNGCWQKITLSLSLSLSSNTHFSLFPPLFVSPCLSFTVFVGLSSLRVTERQIDSQMDNSVSHISMLTFMSSSLLLYEIFRITSKPRTGLYFVPQ